MLVIKDRLRREKPRPAVKACIFVFVNALSLQMTTTNKRAKMALNRSPEFKSANPKIRAAQFFGTLRTPFEQTTMQCSISYIKHLSQLILKHCLSHFPMHVYGLNLGSLARDHFRPHGHHLNKFCVGLLGTATY